MEKLDKTGKVREVKPNSQFEIFGDELKNKFLTVNYGDTEIIEDDEYTYLLCRDTSNKVTSARKAKLFRIWCKDLCNIYFIPHKSGIELGRFEIYIPGRGYGSAFMKMFNEISLLTDIPIYLKLGEPGLFSKSENEFDRDVKRRRNFYHKHGFKRCSDSVYWTNIELIKKQNNNSRSK